MHGVGCFGCGALAPFDYRLQAESVCKLDDNKLSEPQARKFFFMVYLHFTKHYLNDAI